MVNREKKPELQTFTQSLQRLQLFSSAIGSGSKGAVVKTPPRCIAAPYSVVTRFPDQPICPSPAAAAP